MGVALCCDPKKLDFRSNFLGQFIKHIQGLRKKLCKRYLTKLDKAKITGISLI